MCCDKNRRSYPSPGCSACFSVWNAFTAAAEDSAKWKTNRTALWKSAPNRAAMHFPHCGKRCTGFAGSVFHNWLCKREKIVEKGLRPGRCQLRCRTGGSFCGISTMIFVGNHKNAARYRGISVRSTLRQHGVGGCLSRFLPLFLRCCTAFFSKSGAAFPAYRDIIQL